MVDSRTLIHAIGNLEAWRLRALDGWPRAYRLAYSTTAESWSVGVSIDHIFDRHAGAVVHNGEHPDLGKAVDMALSEARKHQLP